MEIHLVGAEFFHVDTQTDMTQLILAFNNFMKAPKNHCHTTYQQKGHTHTCCYKLGNCKVPMVVTETRIYQVQFSIIFQALHNHNF